MGALSELLASLPEEERFILTMHYIRSMSAKEIAETLGVPERAVRPRGLGQATGYVWIR